MIGLVLVAHGPLPEALLESAAMIAGRFEGIATLSLMPGDSLEDLVDRLGVAAEEVDDGDGVLILLDLFGGTPSNAATLLTQQREKTYAVSGVNLPMMLEVLLTRQYQDDVRSLTDTAYSSGNQGVVNIVEKFEAYQRRKQQEETE
jgi:mannose/fructose/sorbose-specific phosphotransferase system IIA component